MENWPDNFIDINIIYYLEITEKDFKEYTLTRRDNLFKTIESTSFTYNSISLKAKA